MLLNEWWDQLEVYKFSLEDHLENFRGLIFYWYIFWIDTSFIEADM